ncbi:MAG: CsgG/HfaB family protein, partial [Spirochaetota bacterium]|nr:CsgG/HfaB family protein [Spirochaetota bacterium]
MRSLRLCSILFFILLSVISVNAAEKIRVAVLDLKAVGIAEKVSGTVSNMIRIDLVNIGKFFVVERTQMDEILKEQGFQKTGCTDQECAVELGRMMSARKILLGEVSSLENSIIITVRIVDVEKGVSEFAAREKAESKDELDNAVSRIVEKLSEQIEQEGETWSITDAYYMRGFVPGWGQMYAGNKMKGIIFGSTFIAACAITVFSVLNYNNAKSDYDDLPSGADRDEFKEKRD